MEKTFVSVSEIRDKTSHIFSLANEQPVCVMRHHTPIGVILSVDDYERIAQFLTTSPRQVHKGDQ